MNLCPESALDSDEFLCRLCEESKKLKAAFDQMQSRVLKAMLPVEKSPDDAGGFHGGYPFNPLYRWMDDNG